MRPDRPRRGFTPLPRVTPEAMESSRSSVASPPATSPTTRPWRMTTMRSLMPMISGRSDEMSRTPRPSSASSPMSW